MRTIALIREALAESSNLLPNVLMDIIAEYAQMSDLCALYYFGLTVRIQKEIEELTLAPEFDNPHDNVTFNLKYVGWPFGVLKFSSTLDLGQDPTIRDTFSQFDKLSEIYGKKWIDELEAAAALTISPVAPELR